MPQLNWRRPHRVWQQNPGMDCWARVLEGIEAFYQGDQCAQDRSRLDQLKDEAKEKNLLRLDGGAKSFEDAMRMLPYAQLYERAPGDGFDPNNAKLQLLVRTEIDAERPMLCRIKFPSGVSHASIICGYEVEANGGLTVSVADPSTQTPETTKQLSFADLCTNYRGQGGLWYAYITTAPVA
jgi:hypothetical protein